MTPEQVAGVIERAYPEQVTIRRQAKGPDGVGLAAPTMVNDDAVIPARVRPRGAAELTQNILQGDRLVVIPATILAGMQWPVPPRVGDQVLIDGKTFTVKTVDTAALGGEDAIYRLNVRGG